MARVDYAQLEQRAADDAPPAEAPPSKRAKRGAATAAAGAAPEEAPPSKRTKRGGDGSAAAPSPSAAAAPSLAAEAEAEADSEAGAPGGDDTELAAIGESERITLTRATSAEFCLTKDEHLATLPYAERPNPHARSAAPMRLYSHRDVLALAFRVHGGRAGLDAARVKREARAKRMADARGARTADRRAELAAALKAQGLKIRSDSWLCDQYLKHGPTAQWPLQAVVRRMGEMRYLHEHTNYGTVLRRVRNQYKEYGERWDAQETADEAEQRVLRGAGGYPAVWPWLAAPGAAASKAA